MLYRFNRTISSYFSGNFEYASVLNLGDTFYYKNGDYTLERRFVNKAVTKEVEFKYTMPRAA